MTFIRDTVFVSCLFRGLFEDAVEADSKGIQYAARPLDSDSMILVALVTGHLGLMHIKTFSELALCEAQRDTKGRQFLTQTMKIRHFAKIPAFQPFIAFYLFGEPEAERMERIKRPFDFVGAETCFLQALLMLGKAALFLLQAEDGAKVFGFVADHDAPPIFTTPRGVR